MLLQNKNAILYGGGGILGGAICRAFAAAGARVFVTGRHLEPVQKVVDEILAAGGKAEVAVVDALDQQSINDHLDQVLKSAGTVDISFNAIGYSGPPNIPLVDLSLEEFLDPIHTSMQTQFLTATAAGRIMMKQGSGVVLSLTNTAAATTYPMLGGCIPALSAMEAFSKSLASELGVYGVRAVNIRSGGSPDSRPFLEATAEVGPEVTRSVLQKLANDTMLKKLPMIADIANVATFLASDMAGKITGVTIDVTCGTTGALNYKPNYQKGKE